MHLQQVRIGAFVIVSVLLHMAVLATLVEVKPVAPGYSQPALELALARHDQGHGEPAAGPSTNADTPTRPSATTRPLNAAAITEQMAEQAIPADTGPQVKPDEPTPHVAAADSASHSQAIQSASANISHSITRRLAAHFHYPPLARKRGWEGRVVLELRVEANGNMSRVRLAESSGHVVLDRAAIESASTIEALPESVHWLAGRYTDILIPVHYRLTES